MLALIIEVNTVIRLLFIKKSFALKHLLMEYIYSHFHFFLELLEGFGPKSLLILFFKELLVDSLYFFRNFILYIFFLQLQIIQLSLLWLLYWCYHLLDFQFLVFALLDCQSDSYTLFAVFIQLSFRWLMCIFSEVFRDFLFPHFFG